MKSKLMWKGKERRWRESRDSYRLPTARFGCWRRLSVEFGAAGAQGENDVLLI